MGENGNTVIFGHSSYWKADEGRYKSIFTDLPEMDVNEEIWGYKKTANGSYEKISYIITASYETYATDVTVLNPEAWQNITLFTCTPIGTAKNRWVVKAKKINIQSSNETVAKIRPILDSKEKYILIFSS